MNKIAPFGTWDSPISAQQASASVLAFQDVVVDGEAIYWSEMRPQEGGRYAIMKASEQGPKEMLPAPWNARTRVHEYGGASFTAHQGIIYFIHFADQRLYRLADDEIAALTPPGIRLAECKMTPYGIIAIAESHQDNGEPKNFLALVHLATGEVAPLAQGDDFYSSPALNQDFTQIAWISWKHPNMPWDDTQLWVANINQQGLSAVRRVDASNENQAFFQPQWNKKGELVVASDKNNWWNLYQVVGDKLEILFSVESEIGQPLWTLGASTWTFLPDNSIACTFFQNGKNHLFIYKNHQLTPLTLPYNHFAQIRAHQDNVVCIAGSPNKATAMLKIGPFGEFEILRENVALNIDATYLSQPKHITFPSHEGRLAHAYFYPPCNKDFQGLPGTKPPLIVKSHGGPTANCGVNLNLDIQYFTSRGFAVVDVNYAGSSGYGRQYRKSLEGNWGIFDVQDCQACALYLAEQGLVDKNKLAITGGSAGGYTTLAALAFTKTFHVGASLYGVSDLAALAEETHKFESRYLDKLIGPYPQEKSTYQQRSPLYHIDTISAPIIFFQGDEDKIVLPNQAQMMVEALQAKGIPTKYILFQGEQHGFRKAENRIQVLEQQKQFYLRAFGLSK